MAFFNCFNWKFCNRNSFIESINVHYDDWKVLWSQDSKNDYNTFKYFIHPTKDKFFCNSLRIPETIDKIRLVNVIQQNLHIYFHGDDMFTYSLFRGKMKVEKESGDYEYGLELEVMRSWPTKSNTCVNNRTYYPDKLKSVKMASFLRSKGKKTWQILFHAYHQNPIFLSISA